MVGYIILLAAICGVQGVYYDSYSGENITAETYQSVYVAANTTYWCTNDLEECDSSERRRVDGSCNNLKHPSRGAPNTPFIRMLPAVYFYDNETNEFESRKAKSGSDMPPPRFVRTRITEVGSVPSQVFTQLTTYYLLLLSGDIVSLQDSTNYIVSKPYCCEPEGKADRFCVPNKISDDDPVHRFSNIRCLNLTRPVSFQSNGCVPNNTTPDRATAATPMFDLSIIYGSTESALNEKGRSFEGGLLKYEEENGRIWPPSSNTTFCHQNQAPLETRCHNTPVDSTNGIFGLNMISIWFWRHHNHIATQLASVNPCWDDEQLFANAREINIAMAVQILYYELMPLLLGRDNLINDGVISESSGFRDLYDEDMDPRMALEFPYILRWVHTIQDASVKMYDTDGNFLKTFPMVNLTMRTGFFALDDNMDQMTIGSFTQPCGASDYVTDLDLVDIGMGSLQKALDILTNDLTKSRFFGFPGYIKYLELCSGGNITSFDGLAGFIDPARIEMLKNVYANVEDIDLLAGVWVERPKSGSHVPSTFYCIIVKQLLRNIVGDRHWYEREDRPYAFTSDQLAQIRNSNIARVMCDVGDSVTRIQPSPFLLAGTDNSLTSCDEIQSLDFSAWADSTCS